MCLMLLKQNFLPRLVILTWMLRFDLLLLKKKRSQGCNIHFKKWSNLTLTHSER